MGVAKAIESLTDILHGLLQHHERMDMIGRSLMIRGVLGLAAAALGALATRSAIGAVIGLAVASLLMLWYYDRPRAVELLSQTGGQLGRPALDRGETESFANDTPDNAIRPNWDLSILKPLIRRAAPLGLVLLLISINTSLPSYFVKPLFGDELLGVFGAMAFITLLGARVVQALGQAASPSLAMHHVNGDRAAFRRVMHKLLLVATAVGVCGILIAAFTGRPLLTKLYGEAFATQANVFVWLMLAAAIGYLGSMFGYAATATRRVAGQPIVQLVVVATTFVGCWAWIPSWGLLGAAWAILAGSVVMLSGFAGLLVVTKSETRRGAR
jgi:O-antigen/teichoic acid export membrane protein